MISHEEESLTQPVPRLGSTLIDGAEMAWAEWGRVGDPVLLLAHATGFHGRCWDQLVPHFHGFRIIAIDFRGHGRSAHTESADWHQFGNDLAEFVEALDLHGVLAVGHSFGGHCIIQAAARVPERLSKLVVIDPVIFAPEFYGAERTAPDAAEHVAKRRNNWDSAQQMFDRFRGREPFSNWQLDVLQDYCQFGLVEDGSDYRLACDPQLEASLYAHAQNMDIHACVAQVSVPVTVVRAKYGGPNAAMRSFMSSPTWPGLAAAFANGKDIHMPEYSHFIPMENPRLVASIIQQHR